VRTIVTTLVVLATLAAGTAGAQAAPACQPLSMVVLGDSYASGTGAGDYQSGTAGNCWRSDNSYAEVVAGQLTAAGRKVALTDVACSGAETADLSQSFKGEPPQLQALKANTDVVFLTIGTNDVDYAAYGGLCLQGDCTGAPTQQILGRLPAMGDSVAKLLGTIKSLSPHAKLVLTGYGRQVTIGDNAPDVQVDAACGAGLLTSDERVQGNSVASGIDATLRAAVTTAKGSGVDVTYVSPYTDPTTVGPVFAGHSLCEAKPSFYRGFDALAPGQEGQEAVFHLNKDGQAALASLIRQKVHALA
jgi:lysophospholipase L1-like esterase